MLLSWDPAASGPGRVQVPESSVLSSEQRRPVGCNRLLMTSTAGWTSSVRWSGRALHGRSVPAASGAAAGGDRRGGRCHRRNEARRYIAPESSWRSQLCAAAGDRWLGWAAASAGRPSLAAGKLGGGQPVHPEPFAVRRRFYSAAAVSGCSHRSSR